MKTRSLIVLMPFILWISVTTGLSREIVERSIEENVRWYIQATDTSSNQELKKRVLSYEDKELKSVMEKIALEPIGDMENHFFELELLAALSWGMEDKDYGRDFTRRVLRLFKDWPFEFSPFFFKDYLKYDPDGAEATFRELADTGNENVRGYAEEYLEKIAERRASGRSGTTASPDLKPRSAPREKETDGKTTTDVRSDGMLWFLITLAAAAALGAALVLLRSRLRSRS